jgi:Leucine-rich repeat (LRR) protein
MLHANLSAHIIDLNAALSTDVTDGGARVALTQLHSDGLAQVMSFAGQSSLTRHSRTFSTVSPQVRLYTEVMKRQPQLFEDFHGVRAERGALVYAIAAVERFRSRRRLEQSMWWARRCGLPLVLDVDNARSDVLALLPKELRGCLRTLRIHVTFETVCMQNTVSSCDGQCGSFLCALSTFPHLDSLLVMCRTAADAPLLMESVNHALHAATQMRVSEVELHDFTQMKGFSAATESEHLSRVTAQHCGITSLSDLRRCLALTVLDVSNNRHLQSLAGLAGAGCLERLYASSCDLQHVDGLRKCPQLRELDVSSNRSLRDFNGLVGAPSLERLIARCCGLRNVDGLNQCPWLAELDVSYNKLLQDLRGLAGAPCLGVLCASGCGLRNLDGLGSCSRLRKVNVSSNGALENLAGLSGAPRLQKINAVSCGLRRVDGLSSCPLLVELVAHYNGALETLVGLAGAPSLEKITAWNCGLRSVEGLDRCPRLCELELSGNPFLHDLHDLAGSTSLRRVSVSRSL